MGPFTATEPDPRGVGVRSLKVSTGGRFAGSTPMGTCVAILVVIAAAVTAVGVVPPVIKIPYLPLYRLKPSSEVI